MVKSGVRVCGETYDAAIGCLMDRWLGLLRAVGQALRVRVGVFVDAAAAPVP